MNESESADEASSVLHHLMFDVDGTLVRSLESDTECFAQAVTEVTGNEIDTDWARYEHATDMGILQEHLHRYAQADEISETGRQVKRVFTEMLAVRIQQQPVEPVPGANEFMQSLIDHPLIVVSIATGGWWDTAMLKLQCAGINVAGVPHASSDDHHTRTGIMEIAQVRSGAPATTRCSYFGDGPWDKLACNALGYNFVQVGDDSFHHQYIADFTDAGSALALAGVI